MTDSNTESDHLDDLKQLHKLVTKNYHNEKALFKAYLEAGVEIFGLETGIVSRIKDDVYTIVSFASPLEGLSAGMTFDLKDTYCREVMKAEKTVAFPHVGADPEMSTHPVYVNMKLESYLSAPIYVNGAIHGTLNFTDRKVSHEGFTKHQYEVLEIMAETIGRFLESQINKDKVNQLVGVVAHDLKNPLGTILTLSDLLLEESLDESVSGLISLINQSAAGCIEMVESILDLNAIETGKIKINKIEVSVGAVVNSAWVMTKHLADKKEIHFSTEGDEVFARLDPERIKQSLTNLFSNAIKFSPRGGNILVSWITEANNLILRVKDSGTGMSEKQIKSVFDPGTVTSTPGTEGEKGTGYGLPLVAKIVKFHKGSISIESTMGEGTTFIIRLPVISS